MLVELVAVLAKISACKGGMQAIAQTEDVARRFEGVLNILNRQRKGKDGTKRPMVFGSDKVAALDTRAQTHTAHRLAAQSPPSSR